ncbi:glycosyltransferase [Desulfomicrobium sp. ZS1]|uniref:glycosyltransferase family 2 protein n=1 Tax=Desulfomicrobium sp. ZS1 TaxID=2952228 RepID=UPI0020B1FD5A|nr:glycosyltransferase [Desulfomicrobium sp. ZS1]UTF49342.1 glycosyltransferase [Desulfomicrobium sp. ZS1]
MEVSSSIYRSEIILPLIFNDKTITNPNKLETNLHLRRNKVSNHPFLLFFENSVAFCNPLNLVQSEYSNRHAGGIQNSAKQFADRFEKGEKLFPNGLKGFTPKSCHQEVKINTNIKLFYEPFISICIPTYNRDKYIKESIESALAQNYNKFEIVIVDDGSTDNTENIVRSIESDKVRYVKKEHSNAPDTRNICIQEAQGEFILWLDSDDHLAANLLTRFQELLADFPDIDVCYGDVQPFGDTGTFVNKTIRYADYYKKNNELLAELVTGNKIPNPGTFIRKNLFLKTGLYDTKFRRAHDYEFWTRASETALFKHIGMISINWRWHDDNMSSENKSYDTSFESRILQRLIEKHPLPNLFPTLEWNNQTSAVMLARGELARMFFHWKDCNQAAQQLERALETLGLNISASKHGANKLEFFSQCYQRLFQATGNEYFRGLANLIAHMRATTAKRQTVISRTRSNSRPMVSVIIPTYNRPEQLVAAIQSVLAQTFSDFEILVVDDCGVDVSKVVQKINDWRISYIRHETNKGLAATRNTALRSANGKYIAYLDDDDEYYPYHLETLLQTLESSRAKVAYTDAEKCIYESKNNKINFKTKFVEHSEEFDRIRLLVQNYIPVLCLMHEKSCLDEVGLFDEAMSVHEDWDLWIRLAHKYPFKHIKKITCGYTLILNSNKNLTTTKRLEFIKTMQSIYIKNKIISSRIQNTNSMQKKCLKHLTLSMINIPESSIMIDDNYKIFVDNNELCL